MNIHSMTQKILFVTHNNQDKSDGVWKKINSQVSALRNIGGKVDFFYMDNGFIIHDNGATKEKINCALNCKYFFYLSLRDYIKKNNEIFNLAYIRKPHGGLFVLFLSFLFSFIKKSGTKIFLEVPTYPYKKELTSYKNKFLDFIFDLSLPFFKKYIDEIIFMGELTDKIWGIKARRISNGIDVESITPIEEKKISEDEFIIVGVANLESWHGYDRIIKGLYEYKGNVKVLFHIVGYSQPELSNLKKMVSQYSLEKYVIFHGKKSGEELDAILQEANVCLDALGRHRSGNNVNSSIKSKEYCARGLPFIKSHEDYSFRDEEFIYQVSPNDEPININNIIQWRNGLAPGFASREREYAENYLTWEKQLEFTLRNE